MVRFISHPTGRRCWPSAVQSALLIALATATLTAQPQAATRVAKPDPLDPQASVPALRYESSFSRYRPLGDEKRASWREANDTVARIGGWRVYAREAQAADAAPAAAPASPAKQSAAASAASPGSDPAGHRGHKQP